VERQQSADGAPSLYKRPLALLVRNHFYREMGRFRMAPTVVSKGQKSHRNHVENFMGEIYNFIIQRSNKSRDYYTISPLYRGNRA